MPQGYVTTARGEVLDMDGLKMKATLPIAEAKQPGRTVNKKTVSKRKPLNVRGFIPARGEAEVPEMPEAIQAAVQGDMTEVKKTKVVHRAGVTAEGHSTLAEITGIRADKPSEATKAKIKAAMDSGAERPAEAASEGALGEILSDLGDSNPNAVKAAESEQTKPTRRTRKKTSE